MPFLPVVSQNPNYPNPDRGDVQAPVGTYHHPLKTSPLSSQIPSGHIQQAVTTCTCKGYQGTQCLLDSEVYVLWGEGWSHTCSGGLQRTLAKLRQYVTLPALSPGHSPEFTSCPPGRHYLCLLWQVHDPANGHQPGNPSSPPPSGPCNTAPVSLQGVSEWGGAWEQGQARGFLAPVGDKAWPWPRWTPDRGLSTEVHGQSCN